MRELRRDLYAAYKFHRQTAATLRPLPRLYTPLNAASALKCARADVAAGKARYPHSARHAALGAAFKGYGTDAMRWCEVPADIGLRFVGYADQLANIGHTGWFTDGFQDGKVRGVVYQLTGHAKHARYVAGYDNADNGAADCGGPAAIDFGTLFEELTGPYGDTDSAKRDAARAADQLAERMAEEAREYQSASQAGFRFAELGDDIAATRKELLALLVERRKARADAAAYPTLCAAIRNRVTSMLRDIETARAERDKLKTGEQGEFSWWTGSAELRAAFNEAAGAAIV